MLLISLNAVCLKALPFLSFLLWVFLNTCSWATGFLWLWCSICCSVRRQDARMLFSLSLTTADGGVPLSPSLPNSLGPGGGCLLCHSLSLELCLNYTKHLSSCDADILSVCILPVPQEVVLVAGSALPYPYRKVKLGIFQNSSLPSPCLSVTSSRVAIFPDKMLSFISAAFPFHSSPLITFPAVSCLETLTMTVVYSSQI